jgi:hypothetical protein
MGTSFQSTGGQAGLMQFKNTVAVQRPELLKWDGWTAGARQYIATHDGDDIELFPLVALYSTRVRKFYAWFWKQVEDEVRLELSEYLAKHNEYCLWRHVDRMSANFGMEGRRVQFRRVAEARLDRAKFPTSGWRLYRLDENGEWVVGERDTDWPPLPKGPR